MVDGNTLILKLCIVCDVHYFDIKYQSLNNHQGEFISKYFSDDGLKAPFVISGIFDVSVESQAFFWSLPQINDLAPLQLRASTVNFKVHRK
jgi:hypothetical protein